jgi:hypothetical protein
MTGGTGSRGGLEILEVTVARVPNNDDGMIHLKVIQVREVDLREICNGCKDCDGCQLPFFRRPKE